MGIAQIFLTANERNGSPSFMGTTIPRLLDEMADASIRTRVELGWLARHMKSTITQGKQGKGGDASSLDAARLLIASMSTVSAPKVEEAVHRIGGQTIDRPVTFDYLLTRAGETVGHEIAPGGSRFETALENLIDLRRHPDIRTADLAGNIAQIGLREAAGQEWPWIEFRPLTGLPAPDRFVFGDFKNYPRSGRGLVRETNIGALAIYRVSAALGLEWQKA